MLEKLNQIEADGLKDLQAVKSEDALQRWKVACLGRNAPLMQVFDQLGTLPKEERPAIGRRANEVKRALEAAYAQREDEMRLATLERSLQSPESESGKTPGRRPDELPPRDSVIADHANLPQTDPRSTETIVASSG